MAKAAGSDDRRFCAGSRVQAISMQVNLLSGGWRGCRRLVLPFSIALMAFTPAHAQLTVRQYLDLRQEVGKNGEPLPLALRLYFGGVLDGVRSMAAGYTSAGIAPPVCLPAALPQLDLARIIDDAVKSQKATEDDSVMPIAMLGLKRRYPCK